MKAKEYFEEYAAGLFEEFKAEDVVTDGAFARMYKAFFGEMMTIAGNRHARSNQAMLAIIEEQNRKWNAVRNMCIKVHGYSPISEDGFKNAVYGQIGIKDGKKVIVTP